MAEKTAAQKAGVKPGTTVALVNDVPGVVASLGFPEDTAFVDAADAHIVVLVATERVELERLMPATVERLAPGAQLWVLFRKGGKAAGIDVGRDSVWSIADGLGMRPLGLLSVDEAWSAFRLRRG